MSDTWLISDTHFQHKNIIKYCRPEFSDVDEMDEYIIEQWNAFIKPNDNVIHGGDLLFGNKDRFCEKIFPRLNGTITALILGNHDNAKFLIKRQIVKQIYVWMPIPSIGAIVSHIPLHNFQLMRYSDGVPALNIHGHIHDQPSPEGPYLNICVEQTGYKPLHFDDIIDYKEMTNE